VKPDARILDENLRSLLVRAYVPALPRPEFRLRLETGLENALSASRARRRARRPRAPRLLRPALVLAAAGLLLVAGFLLRALLVPARLPTTAEEVLARAPVAVRMEKGWRSASDAELAEGLALGEDPIEIALVEGAGLDLLAADGRIHASGAARLALETRPSLSGSLSYGGLFLERNAKEGDGGAPASSWTLRTGSGELAFAYGALEVARTGETERFLLERGSANFSGARERWTLAPGQEFVLVAGLPPRAALAAASSEPDRRPLAEPETPAPDETDVPGAPAILGAVRTADGSLADRFRIALLPVRIGNELPSPLVRDFEAARGSFRWEEVPPGRYRPFVWAEEHALAALDEIEIAEGSEPIRLDLRLARGGSLRGRVIDPTSGDGVPGALVLSERDVPQHALLFADADREAWLPASTRTSADGSFELAHLSAGEHTLRASAAGFAPAWTSALSVSEGGLVQAVLIALSPGGAVEGRVLGADGLGRSGERLLVTPMDETRHPQMNLQTTETDAEGRFRVEDLLAGYVLVIHVERGEAHPVVKPAEIRAGESAWVEFGSEPTGTRLLGLLLDEAGRPLAHKNLALYAKDPALEGRFDDFLATGTLADGNFVFENLAPGGYLLFRVGNLGRWIRCVDEVEVPPLASFEHTFRVGPCAVEGTLRDRRTGEPVGNAVLLLERLDAATGRPLFAGNAEADPAGGFRIDGLAPGRYVVQAHPTQGGLGHERSREVVLSEDEPDARLDLEFSEGGSIEVHVVDADGNPRARAQVLFVDEEDMAFTFAQFPLTDEHGIFLAQGVRAGRYRVRVSAEGYETGTTAVECRAGERAQAEVVLESNATEPNERKER